MTVSPAHFNYAARNYIETAYTGRWIGKNGPISWPSRSPNLDPLDLFLRGHLEIVDVCISGGY
jgi:hypothetical protein